MEFQLLGHYNVMSSGYEINSEYGMTARRLDGSFELRADVRVGCGSFSASFVAGGS